jgi:hypothetical protein
MLAGVVVVGVFGAVAWTLDQRDVRPMVAVVAGRLRRRDGRTNRPETTGDEDRVP